MDSSNSEGLGLSVAIFMVAIVGVLAILALPVWLAVRPQVFANPVLAQSDPLLNGPIAGYRPDTAVPLAVLDHEPLVDPKFVATLNGKLARTEKSEAPAPEHHAPRRSAQRGGGTPVAELNPERPDRHERAGGFFLFNLFGG